MPQIVKVKAGPRVMPGAGYPPPIAECMSLPAMYKPNGLALRIQRLGVFIAGDAAGRADVACIHLYRVERATLQWPEAGVRLMIRVT
jgi:hypothetical protein